MADKGNTVVKKTKPSKLDNFETHIRRVLNKVSPNSGLSSGAVNTLNGFIHVVTRRIADNADLLLHIANKVTVSLKEAKAATNLTLPASLYISADSEAMKAVTRFNDSINTSSNSNTKVTAANRAGLLVSVSRIGNYLRDNAIADRQGRTSSIYVAAIIEYLLSELLMLANKLKDSKKVRITNRPLLLAIRSNEDFNKLLPRNRTILAGGVFPH